MPRTQRSNSTARNRRGGARRMVRGRRPPTERQYQAAFVAWKKGEQISDLAESLGVRRGTLRHYLTKFAGGHDEFYALRAAGAGGLRPSLGERPLRASIDRGARVLRVGKRRNWKYRTMKASDSETPIPVFVAPGRGGGKVEYVPAGKRQKADVVALMGNGLPPARLVKLVKSAGSRS